MISARGVPRFTGNRHCVKCAADACLLLVIEVPVKSGFEQLRLVLPGGEAELVEIQGDFLGATSVVREVNHHSP